MQRCAAILVLGLIGVGLLAACETAGDPSDVEVDADFRYASQVLGGALVADFTMTNPTSRSYDLYAFAYAQNPSHSPPLRGAYPAGALRDVGIRDTFRVLDPTLGEAITLPADGEASLEAEIPLPGLQGEMSSRTSRFTEVTLYLYDEEGERVYEEQWTLDGQGTADS